MDYVRPADVAKAMVETGSRKLTLSISDLLIRGMLSGAILGVATSLAFNASFTTGQPLVGALIFPVGLVMIVLLGLELITGSFALVPLPWLRGEATGSAVIANWGWVFLGNLIGSVAYGALLAIALTDMGAIAPAGVAARLIAAAEAKTTGYEAFGFAGMVTVFVKAMLCNWMVCLAVVLAMTHDLHHRQDRDRLDADPDLLRPGLRALRRQHVHHSDRHDDGRQGHGRAVVVLEPDPGDARQSRRRLRLHRARHLHDLPAAAGSGARPVAAASQVPAE